MLTELGDIDKLYPRVTIGALPDDVLLEIFDFYLVESYLDAWHTLVHVCRRWRYVVFASPHRLQLQLLCTNKRPVQNTPDVWQELPIVIRGSLGMSRPQDVNNIIAALTRHNRVCKIDIDDIPNSFFKIIRAMKLRNPFPALTSLRLTSQVINAPILSKSFLGRSAPQLQALFLNGVPFPALPKLFLSTRDLVKADLRDIPLSGYISPEAMVAGLSALTRLQTLRLEFRSPRSRADRENRLLPRMRGRIVLPALTSFDFKGDSEYLEDIITQIDTPQLHGFYIALFNQLMFDTPRLRDFISRTETFKAPCQAHIWFSNGDVKVSLFRRDRTDGHHRTTLSLEILCRPPDWQLSSLVQVCSSSFPPFTTLQRLEIYDYRRQNWQGDMENIQWLEMLRPFTAVNDLELHDSLVPLVAAALEELAVESVTDLLPALQNLFLQSPQSEPVNKAIGKFITARQLYGCPVAVHY